MSGRDREILMGYLQELSESELKRFKIMLKDYPVIPGCSNIPGGWVENADRVDIVDKMISQYNEKSIEIAEELLKKIPRLDLLKKNKELHEIRCNDSKKIYKEYVKEKFKCMNDKDQIGGNLSLSNKYTKLLIVKEPPLREEREHEIMFYGEKHLEIMSQRAEHSYSEIKALFDPDEEEVVHKTVVLQGAAGIGKTITVKKIMVDWASGELFQGRFDYVIYINCREINQLSEQLSIDKLLSHSCAGISIPMREIVADPPKLLFIVDGFDELHFSIDPKKSHPCKEAQKDNTMMSLIKKTCFFQSSIIITTRPTALEKLKKCAVNPRFAEILGFSEDDRREYFSTFFKGKTKGDLAFNIVKENEFVFTMCFVPIVCWIVCTVIQQQTKEKKDPVDALRTTTSVYMSFFSSLLKQQSSESVQPIHMNLQKLCALAKEGVWEKKILFDEKDLMNHGLAIPAIQSLLLKKDIFLKGIKSERCYSFIHLSFQEFFAAMFYLLRGNETSGGPSKRRKSKQTAEETENPQRDVIRLLESSRTQKHLMLTVRFLFGLLNKETLNQMEKRFKWKISPDVKPALLAWIKNEIDQYFNRINLSMEEQNMEDFKDINNDQMELIHCLYEIQDEEFVKSATEDVKHIMVTPGSLQRQVTAMDFRALGFWIKNSPGVELVYIAFTEISPADLRALTPGLMKCGSLALQNCSLTAAHCAELCSVLSTNTSLSWLDLGYNILGDSGVIALCEALKDPGCTIQTLELWNNGLTDASTEALCSALRTNPTLRYLWLSENRFTQRSEAAFREFEASGRFISL